MRFKSVTEIIGKRIAHVVIKERTGPPRGQIIIVFDDGDVYEIYSHEGDMSGSGKPISGGLAGAQAYLAQEATSIKTYP